MPLINPGQPAPAFTLPDKHGTPRSLAEFKGSHVVLYFYPKDDTSSCTAQACAFRDTMPNFDRSKAVIIGISPDDQRSHTRFASKYDLAFTLLSDTPDAGGTPPVCNAFGVWAQKSMYGRTYMGVVRTTYIINPQGVVTHRFDKVSVTGHAAEVLNVLGGAPAPAPAKKPKPAPAKKTSAAKTSKVAKTSPARATSKAAAKAKPRTKPAKKTAAKAKSKPARRSASR